MGDYFGGYVASALRSVLVLLMLLPFAFLLKKFEPMQWRKNGHLIAGMVIASLFIWGPLYYAFNNAGIGVTLTINYATIVIGMFFFGWLLAGEKFTRDKSISVLLGLIGLFLIFSPNTEQFGVLAMFAAAVSGFGSAINTVIVKLLPYNSMQTTVVLWTTSVISNAIMVVILNETIPNVNTNSAWIYLVLFALASVLATLALVRGIQSVEAGVAGILGLMEIIFGVVFGLLFFNESLTLTMLMGTVIIMAAASIPLVKDYKVSSGTLG